MKNALKSILFMGIFFLLLIGTSYWLLPQEAVYHYGIIKTAHYDILGEEKDTIDVVVVGDSLIYSAVSPMEIWHEYGFTVFDSATQGQLIRDSFKHVQVAVESQHPKMILLEANVLYRDAKNKPWSYDYEEWFKMYNPYQGYHNNWKRRLLTMFQNEDDFTNINVFKGFKYITDSEPTTKTNYMKKSKKKKKIPEENQRYFQQIVKYCKDNNVKLVVISTPSMKVWNYAKHNGIEKFVSSYGIDYVDFNLDDTIDIDWNTETRDQGDHLNYKGAIKFSHALGAYLKKTDLVVDHRSDSAYQSWNEGYRIYQKSLK